MFLIIKKGINTNSNYYADFNLLSSFKCLYQLLTIACLHVICNTFFSAGDYVNETMKNSDE